MKNINFFFLFFSLLLSTISYLLSLEVSGYITEDTTWSPENNPYHVIDDVIVDDNVILTILPGTIVKFNAARLKYDEDMEDFEYYNGSNIAKMLQVDGRLIAEGTEEEPIIFTRIQDSLYFHWGIIYMTEFADRCSFKHCTFQYSAYLLIVLGIIPCGAVSSYNEELIVEDCEFIDNFTGIYTKFYPQNMIIKNSIFTYDENISPYYTGSSLLRGVYIAPSPGNAADNILIVGNTFSEFYPAWGHLRIDGNTPAHIIDNRFNDDDGIFAFISSETGSYIFNNEFNDCHTGISGGREGNSLYIKNNYFDCDIDGIYINYSYIEICDNYFDECGLYTGFNTQGIISNNIVNSGSAYAPGIVDYFNNISFNNENGIGLCATYQRISCTNNISIYNQYAFEASESFDNCVFIGNDEFEQFGITGNPIFRNCILDFELPEECIDGGGNIWIDSLQAMQLFEDIENGDFHLIEGSLAIDAGFDTTNYYYPFDMDYNYRVWDGDNDGNAVIDIGLYEFGAPAFTKITGCIKEADNDSRKPVDYALLKINNEPGEFTFSDSIGYFEIALPPGTYDIYAERVFYEDAVVYDITLGDDEDTEIEFFMTHTDNVTAEDDNIQSSILNIRLWNYPNPFHNSTTISFETTNLREDSRIEIYNIKGQKVKQFSDIRDQISVVWDGTDDHNRPVSSGMYMIKLNIDDETKIVRKMIVLHQ